MEEQQVVDTQPGTEIGNGGAETTPQEPSQQSVLSKDAAPEVNVTETPEVPQYTPNFKFKYTGGLDPVTQKPLQQEKEFDDFLRASIKDAESEKKVRELYEKAYGLDFVKPNYEDYKKKYPELEQKYSQLDGTVNEILDLRDRGIKGDDAALEACLEQMRIPEEAIAKWMLAKIKKMELPPEQQQVYNQFEETRKRNLVLERQFQELEGRTQSQAVHARTVELETGLQKPEVSSFVRAFDNARKEPGAFRKEVQERGLYEWKVNGKDISAEEAISLVMSRYQGLVTPQAAVNAPEVSNEPLPVIPRVKGKAVSATGKQVRSIEDIKKKYSEIAGS
jgi:hypothetical protein